MPWWENEIEAVTPGGSKSRCAVRKEYAMGQLKAISADVPGFGNVTWENPFIERPFSDEQIAVATLLSAMSEAIIFGGAPAYTTEDFNTDIEIVQAFRYSAARGGTPISLPLQDSLEKSKLLTSPHYWLSKTNW